MQQIQGLGTQIQHSLHQLLLQEQLHWMDSQETVVQTVKNINCHIFIFETVKIANSELYINVKVSPISCCKSQAILAKKKNFMQVGWHANLTQKPKNNSRKLNNANVSINPASILRGINIHHWCTENFVLGQYLNSFT